MRSFVISLVLFILLMCSCKTKEVARETNTHERFTSDISVLNKQAKVDTTKTKIIEQTEEFTRIIKRETITEYDTEKQTPSKVTEKEEIFEQGNNSQTDKIEGRVLTENNKVSTDHFVDVHEMAGIKEEIKEESAGNTFFLTLGKWLGIGIVVLIGIFLVWKKLKGLLPL